MNKTHSQEEQIKVKWFGLDLILLLYLWFTIHSDHNGSKYLVVTNDVCKTECIVKRTYTLTSVGLGGVNYLSTVYILL